MNPFGKIAAFISFFICMFPAFSLLPVNNKSQSFSIQFENYVGNQLLDLDTVFYKNELSQTYTVSKFKYYISNIHLKGVDGKEFVSNEYFLIDEEVPGSKNLVLKNIYEGAYASISFIIGVDSLRNCSGVQSGALDPINGMFWAWNTGYIFLKLEGHAPQSKSTANIFEFHIGGYKEPANCIRSVTLDLTKSNSGDAKKSIHSILLKTDIDQIFKSPLSIDLSKLSSVTDFNNAEMVADNYKDMFSILTIK